MNYYDFALKDYNMMKLAYSSSSDYDSIVVMGQQYLEKGLKRILELKCNEVYTKHKLTVIISKLNIIEFMIHEDYFRKVQDYYFDRRYPGENYIETTKEECDYLVKFVEEIKPVIEYYIDKYKSTNSVDNTVKSSNVFGDI